MAISKILMNYLDIDIKKHFGQLLIGSQNDWKLTKIEVSSGKTSENSNIQIINVPLINVPLQLKKYTNLRFVFERISDVKT